MAYYVVLAVVLIAVLNLFGIETTSLIAVFGAAGLAVGLALQGTLSNFAAGVMLLIFRPIRVSDFVEVAGQAGTVTEISIFSRLLNTSDNVRLTILNAQVYGDTVKNYSFNDTRRIDLIMGIGDGDNIGTAVSIIERVINSDERTLRDPAPTVAVAELADSSVNLVVRPWCKQEGRLSGPPLGPDAKAQGRTRSRRLQYSFPPKPTYMSWSSPGSRFRGQRLGACRVVGWPGAIAYLNERMLLCSGRCALQWGVRE
jgi:small-conductance mechanosensitive channel